MPKAEARPQPFRALCADDPWWEREETAITALAATDVAASGGPRKVYRTTGLQQCIATNDGINFNVFQEWRAMLDQLRRPDLSRDSFCEWFEGALDQMAHVYPALRERGVREKFREFVADAHPYTPLERFTLKDLDAAYRAFASYNRD